MSLRRHPSLAVLAAILCLAGAPRAQEALSTFGGPGLVEMPAAFTMPDGTIALAAARIEGTLRTTLAFQVLPGLTGSFRYARFAAFGDGEEPYLDRSFDLRLRLMAESGARPAVALGFQDFGGTGIYGGEFLVASRHLTPRVAVSGGIGWGRYGSRGGFRNPLAALDDSFADRPGSRGIEGTGQVAPGRFFHGDAALFGGMTWQATDRLRLAVEYSSDDYVREGQETGFAPRSPVNAAVTWRLRPGLDLTAYALQGTAVGAMLSLRLDAGQDPVPGGAEPAPPPIGQRPPPGSSIPARDGLDAAFAREGLEVLELTVTGPTARLALGNDRYGAVPEAIGRAARILANALPPQVETLEIVPVEEGVPVSLIRLDRSDLEALEFALDGTWQSYARADIEDAAGVRLGTGPAFDGSVAPYLAPYLFDPDAPLRLDVGIAASAAWSPAPGLILSGGVRQPAFGTLDSIARTSGSDLPHVRSDSGLYETESELELTWLTVERLWRPGPSLYARVTGGYLERMFGGVSAEVLWAPVDRRLALGAELNWAVQRDFDIGFGLRDYDVATSHASAYWDMGGGFVGQLDAGRYLAGDWGGTLTLDRRFDNGVRLGAYVTLTDVPFETFGEGSFDKGLRIEIPLAPLTGRPTRATVAQTIQPVLRDGGARLSVRNRLFELTADAREPALGQTWGRFWR